MKKIQVAFYKANGPFARWDDKVIAWWTNGPYSHVELVIDGYHYGIHPSEGRVRKIKRPYSPDVWDYFVIEIPEVDKIIDFFKYTHNMSYNWNSFIAFVFPVRPRNRSFTCSEWVASALILGGLKAFYGYKPCRFSPNDLFRFLKEYYF